MKLRLLALPAFAATAALGCHIDVPAAPSPDTAAAHAASAPGAFHLRRALAAPRGLRLANVNGAVDVSPSDDGVLDVRAGVRGQDVSKIRIVAREEEAGVAICVLTENERDDACRFAGTERHDVHLDGDDARVDLFARVPSDVRVLAETMNGSLRGVGLHNDVELATLNGNIELSTVGDVSATTLNGSIAATFRAPPRTRASLATTRGDVRVRLTTAIDAELSMATTLGDVTASFPLRVESTPLGVGPKSARATLGKGGAPIVLETTRGNVDVRTGDGSGAQP